MEVKKTGKRLLELISWFQTTDHVTLFISSNWVERNISVGVIHSRIFNFCINLGVYFDWNLICLASYEDSTFTFLIVCVFMKIIETNLPTSNIRWQSTSTSDVKKHQPSIGALKVAGFIWWNIVYAKQLASEKHGKIAHVV